MTQTPPDHDKLLTPGEAAELLGVSVRTVNRWAQQGWISAVKTLGGHRRFEAAQIRVFLASRSTPTRDLETGPIFEQTTHTTSPVPGGSLAGTGTAIPTLVAELLRAMRSAEETASGPRLRIAQRLTRMVIGGVVDAGFSSRLIAEVLGVSLSSIKARADRGRWIPLEVVPTALNIEASLMSRWIAAGFLPRWRVDPRGSTLVPAVDLVRVLALSPSTTASPTPRPPDLPVDRPG